MYTLKDAYLHAHNKLSQPQLEIPEAKLARIWELINQMQSLAGGQPHELLGERGTELFIELDAVLDNPWPST